MSIQVGDKIPEHTFSVMGAEGPEGIASADIFSGKKVILFAVPGAFTPGCSKTHLPGYVVHYDNLIAKGVDTVACVSVNDPFVMGAWGEAQNAENLLMLADGNCEFTNKIGLQLDGTGFGLGTRSQRYAMIVDDGVVSLLNIDEGEIKASAVETIMDAL